MDPIEIFFNEVILQWPDETYMKQEAVPLLNTALTELGSLNDQITRDQANASTSNSSLPKAKKLVEAAYRIISFFSRNPSPNTFKNSKARTGFIADLKVVTDKSSLNPPVFDRYSAQLAFILSRLAKGLLDNQYLNNENCGDYTSRTPKCEPEWFRL